MNKKILLYGFGRMGLTHYSILNQLIENCDFVFVDPDKKVNYFAKKNLNARIVSSDENLTKSFDFALICTPPMFHIPILEKCIKNKIPSIFVEKPFGGVNNNFSIEVNSQESISVGYVLRFNPIVQWIKESLDIEQIASVEGYYFSNTIEKKPKGWRNGSYSGVTNEVGAHIIDLCIYLFGLSDPILIDKKVDSVISDVDDILITDLQDKSIKYHFHFDWVNKEYRKPVFKFVIVMKDGSLYKFDQQKVEHYLGINLLNRVTAVDIASKVPFYLRGIEFTNQMQDFIGPKNTIASVQEALLNRNLIKKLIS
jgi:predicted dehydrogenase